MKITLVKKVFADGSPCKKCAEIEHKMREAGQLEHFIIPLLPMKQTLSQRVCL